jgi:hypothetical protein
VSVERLRAELGGPPPDEFSALSRGSLADLASLVTSERARRAQAYADAVGFALRRVPARARTALVRRVLQ